MPEITTPGPTTLVVRHTYDAPRDRVFAAWVTPEILKTFFAPAGYTIGVFEADLREGGSFAIAMHGPDGALTVRGVYREIRRPERIAFSWKWDEETPEEEHDSLVTIDFIERGEKTELVLTHTELRDEESRDGHAAGWSSALENLAAML